jgi:hypothetical protein
MTNIGRKGAAVCPDAGHGEHVDNPTTISVPVSAAQINAGAATVLERALEEEAIFGPGNTFRR